LPIAVPPLLALGLVLADPGVEEVTAAAQHEEREHEDRHRGEDRVHEADPDVAQDAGGVAEAVGQLARLLLEAAGDVVVLLELAQAIVLVDELAELLRVLRQVLHEVVRLRDDRRHEQADQREGREDQEQVDDRDREPAPHPALEEGHRARQRDGEEAGDEDPRQRLAQQVHQRQRQHDRDDHQHHPQHGADRRELRRAGGRGTHGARPGNSPPRAERLPGLGRPGAVEVRP